MSAPRLDGTAAVVNPSASADRLLVHAVIVVGFTAGYIVHPAFFAATPIIALSVFRAARNAERLRLEVAAADDDLHAPELPERTRMFVDAASKTLLPGDARRLLVGVVMQARPLFASRATAFTASDNERALRQTAELVEAACASAITLQRLDGVASNDPAHVPGARELFVTRLDDAAKSLRQLLLAGVDRGTPELDRVADLTGELRTEAKARAAATRELDDLFE